jgi:hypothetical protein
MAEKSARWLGIMGLDIVKFPCRQHGHPEVRAQRASKGL